MQCIWMIDLKNCKLLNQTDWYPMNRINNSHKTVFSDISYHSIQINGYVYPSLSYISKWN